MGRRQVGRRELLGEAAELEFDCAGLVGVADFDFGFLARFQGAQFVQQLVAVADGLAGQFHDHVAGGNAGPGGGAAG